MCRAHGEPNDHQCAWTVVSAARHRADHNGSRLSDHDAYVVDVDRPA